MNEILKEIENYGIIPVVKIENAKDAVSLGKSLCKAGLPVAEITFRTESAEESINYIAKNIPEMLVGAGTVLTVEQVKKAIGAGAKFIVSPGFNPKVVEYCINNNFVIFPGVNSPSQIEIGIEYGLKTLKFFPAEESGGVAFLKAISAPYSGVQFIPTGGINQNNISSYLSLGCVCACGGSWMVKTELITQEKFDEIEKLTADAIKIMLGFEIAHLGINEENEDNANNSVEIFSKYFHFQYNAGTSSIFLGQNMKEIEVMKKIGLGKKGHLAISTNNINRALFYLKKSGLKELSETRNEKHGVLKSIYLELEISGFAIHLLQK